MSLFDTIKDLFKDNKKESLPKTESYTEKKEFSPQNFDDTYYIFHNDDVNPSENDKYAYFVKTKRDWEQLGFKIKVIGSGQAIKNSDEKFRFARARLNDETIQRAIQTGKRATYPAIVPVMLERGFSLDEFATVPESFKYYCRAALAKDKNDYITALDFIEKCISQKDEEEFANWTAKNHLKNDYFSLYSEVCGKMLKTDALKPVLQYYENDMDSFVSVGYLKLWTSSFLKLRQFDNIPILFDEVRSGLQKLINETNGKRMYSAQSTESYKYDLEKFKDIKEKTLTKIEKLQAKSGDEIKAEEISKIIFEFIQLFLANENKNFSYTSELDSRLFSLCYEDKLDKNIISRLDADMKKHLYQLLTQYVMFFTTSGKDLTFPYWFLEGKRKETIPFNILHYIAEHKWIYPQLLKNEQGEA